MALTLFDFDQKMSDVDSSEGGESFVSERFMHDDSPPHSPLASPVFASSASSSAAASVHPVPPVSAHSMPQGGSSTGRGGQAEPPKPAESHKGHISQGEGALIELPPTDYDFETTFWKMNWRGLSKHPRHSESTPGHPRFGQMGLPGGVPLDRTRMGHPRQNPWK